MEYTLKQNVFKIFFGLLIVLVSNFFIHYIAQAQVKTYLYQNFDAKVTVNKDSTIDVEETENLAFSGEFHNVYRDIPLSKIGSITDISVIDLKTNQALVYSPSQLDKTLPTSWGKYTYYKSGGNMNIVWYFNAQNETHAWLVKYKVHGALGFYKENVRLYWNIFSGFSVPILSSRTDVVLPAGVLNFTAYRSSNLPIAKSKNANGNRLIFSSENFSAGEAFTVDISLPSNSITTSAYWKDFAKTNYGYIGSILLVLLTILLIIGIWLKREKLPEGKGTIVPEYEPPQKLKPAIAEALLTEGVTNKGLTATMVDLAVKGYVKIEEDDSVGGLKKMMLGLRKITILFRLGFGVFLLGVVIIAILTSKGGFNFTAPLILFFLFTSFVVFSAKFSTDYKVLLLKSDYLTDPALDPYEKKYLELLFAEGMIFSTFKMKTASNTRKRELYEGMQEVKKEVLKNAQTDTKAFEVSPDTEKNAYGFAPLILVALIFLAFIQSKTGIGFSQLEAMILIALLCFFVLFVYIKYEARLSQQGRILRDDWLGFKLFLETAERYRLQNLTPDMFQKFLPYAMIFGIEKKWAKAFEGMDVPPPSWYHGATVGYVSGSSGFSSSSSGGFSPTGFSTSFSTAFSSAFASSGASGGGGGGGGGGGAGGGGGGGGGGAG